FSFTLDGDYDEGPVLVMAKAGPNSNTAVITGPVDPQCSDSNPPVPEISTIIMLSLGLVALGGFVLVRRRMQATVSA
ncbi:MAG: PEP-CTERM sorting domain-containing protein, partial [candidate division Zixibacteria bacterium]|nr:PEP-CTERM sorting domain-containing protein [candidate division Zixibacteria bacterium]